MATDTTLSYRIAVAILSVLLAHMPTIAVADEAGEARLRDQLRQAVTQLRQLQDENAELKGQLQSATEQLASRPALAAAEDAQLLESRRLAEAQTQKSASLQAQVEQDKTVLAQWRQSYDQVVGVAKACDAAFKIIEAQYLEVSGHVKTCDDDNAKLVEISEQLLDRYKNKGVFQAMRDQEALLGLQRMELERLAQDYHSRIVDATIEPAPQPAQPVTEQSLSVDASQISEPAPSVPEASSHE